MPFISLFSFASRSVPILQMGELRHRGINSLPRVTQVDSDSQLSTKHPASSAHPHTQPPAAGSSTASTGPRPPGRRPEGQEYTDLLGD